MGASQATGLSSDDQAPKGLAPSGFDPSRVWVLFCVTGEYSDRSEWPIGFVRDEGAAKRLTARAGEEWRAANVLHPRVDYPDGDVPWAEVTEEQAEKWDEEYRAAQARRDDAIKAMLTVHPEAVSDCEYDDPYYFYREVDVLPASAIEARSDETRRGSAEGESAARRETPNA